jgi:hypothetical protein
MKKLLLILVVIGSSYGLSNTEAICSLSNRIDSLDNEIYTIKKKLNMAGDTLTWKEKYNVLMGEISIEQMQYLVNPKYRPDLEQILHKRR